MWSGAISLGLLLQALTAQAIIRYECNDPGLKTKIQNAVEEAIEMATSQFQPVSLTTPPYRTSRLYLPLY